MTPDQVFYCVVLIHSCPLLVVVSYRAILEFWGRRPLREPELAPLLAETDRYEVAHMIGGPTYAALLAVRELAEAGIVQKVAQVDWGRGRDKYTYRATASPSPDLLHPIEAAVLATMSEPVEVPLEAWKTLKEFEVYRRRLKDLRLAWPSRWIRRLRVGTLLGVPLLFFLPLGLGGAFSGVLSAALLCIAVTHLIPKEHKALWEGSQSYRSGHFLTAAGKALYRAFTRIHGPLLSREGSLELARMTGVYNPCLG